MKIAQVDALRVWDSRGRPTVEVAITTESGVTGCAIAPAGASTGSGEALDLRDGGTVLNGYDVQGAVQNVKSIIAPGLIGLHVCDQTGIDSRLEVLDGTELFSNLGGNAAIASSMATVHAAANVSGLPLWQYLLGDRQEKVTLPVPEIQIFGGGAHANGQMDLQDFMIVPFGATSFSQAIEWAAEIYLAAGKMLEEKSLRYGVADEGGYWPVFDSNEAAIECLQRSIELAGFDPVSQVGMSLDIAATQFYKDGHYFLSKDGEAKTPDEWYSVLAGWVEAFPVCMIEDPFNEHDFERHSRFCSQFGKRLQIVGDDLLVTNTRNISKARQAEACNTLLCKPNQAGTLSRAKAAADAAQANGWDVVVSARSGETEDVTIAHLVTGWGLKQLKVGSFSRSERMAKWNEMLRIEKSLGQMAGYAGNDVFGEFLEYRR